MARPLPRSGSVHLEIYQPNYMGIVYMSQALVSTDHFNRSENIINKGINDSAKIFLESIKTDLFNFIGDASQSDDITMLALELNFEETI